MYDVGDIVLFYSNLAQKKKYHLCLIKPSGDQAGLFLFLNSKNSHNALAIDCNRIPELRPTPSGQSYICCDQICYSELILREHVPKKNCQLDTQLCEELLRFVDAAPSIERRIKYKISKAIGVLVVKRRPDGV